MMAEAPVVPPFESCIHCYRGDTSTGFALRGEAEWIVAGLRETAGLTHDQAEEAFFHWAEHGLGCEPGAVPDGEVMQLVRLCTDCAGELGTNVGEFADGLPIYHTEEGP